ncbi:cell division cycle protein 48 [Acrasis kona]|uniref:Cell division cycle protein 48 n=1 Tax=Acrasis kona TaxID=1008807 RepID=A0AAW2YPG6_9EUKA
MNVNTILTSDQVNDDVIHLAPSFFDPKKGVKYYATLTVNTEDNKIIVLEARPEQSLCDGQSKLSPFIANYLKTPLQTSIIQNTTLSATSCTITLLDSGAKKPNTLERTLNYIGTTREKCLFAKPFPQDGSWVESTVKRKLANRTVMNRCLITFDFLGEKFAFQVSKVKQGENEIDDPVLIDLSTSITVRLGEDQDLSDSFNKKLRIDEDHKTLWNKVRSSIGGLDDQIKQILVLLDSLYNDDFDTGLKVPRTMLMWGVEGTGKSLLLKLLAEEYMSTGINVLLLNSTHIKDITLPEEPFLVMIDDMDLLGEDYHSESSPFHMLLHSLFEQVHKCTRAALICATRSVNAIDSRLRSSGRLERELYIPVPNHHSRSSIIQIMINKCNMNIDLVDKINTFTPGFVGRDLERLFRLAQMRVLCCNGQPKDAQWSDFEYALRVVKPSQLLEADQNESHKYPDKFAGYESASQRCRELMYWPLKRTDDFLRLNLPLSCGILLFGPSGCGKTTLVRSLASLGGMSYLSIKCTELFSKYTGETESQIRDLFDRARKLEPCVIVFDEIDAIAPRRDEQGDGDGGTSSRALSQLLNEMDGIKSRRNVFIVGCTNRKENIDSAVMRPGRLDHLIELGYPTTRDRLLILQSCIKFGDGVADHPIPLDPHVDLNVVAEQTQGMTGADLAFLCREAAMEALRQDIKSNVVNLEHFNKALMNKKLHNK